MSPTNCCPQRVLGASFWPGSDIEPFATFINGVQKFVATSSPPEQTWAHTAVVDGALADFVTELKQQPGGDIGLTSPTGYLLVDFQMRN